MKPLGLHLEAKKVLEQLSKTINMLSVSEFNQKHGLLSNSSIGEHTRHIIELFQQLTNGYLTGELNYDNRKRDSRLQQDVDFAIAAIEEVSLHLDKPDKRLQLITTVSGMESKIESNYFRELMFNMDHCIHHQAIIKIALLNSGMEIMDADFGVAQSTIEYRKQCAQ